MLAPTEPSATFSSVCSSSQRQGGSAFTFRVQSETLFAYPLKKNLLKLSRIPTSLAVCIFVIGSYAGVRAAAIESPPVITVQPQPQTSFPGANINLRVSATSFAPLQYYWRFYGTNLPGDFPGQFSPLLALRDVTTNATGPYSVIVSNKFGAVTSETAVVTVNSLNSGGGGYVNLTAMPGNSLFCTALSLAGTNQNIAVIIPAAPDGASLVKIDGTGFLVNNYLDGWSDPEMNLSMGEAWFLNNPHSNTFTVTLVGGFPSGTLINRLPAGFAASGNVIPLAGPISGRLNFPRESGSKLFFYDRESRDYRVFEPNDFNWFPYEPELQVGQSFFVSEPAGIDWVQQFSQFPSSIPPVTYLMVQPSISSETGEINVFTYNADPAFGRVLDFDGVTPLNDEFAAQLYAGLSDVEDSLVPIGRPSLFLNGAGAGYIRSSSLKLLGIRGGETIHLQLRVWEKRVGRTYEQAVYNGSAHGRSAVFGVMAHAPVEHGEPGLPPNNANSFPSFSISVGDDVPFRIGSVASAEDNKVKIYFATQPGRRYYVEKAGSLQEPVEWSAISNTANLIGTGHVNFITDHDDGRGYYRALPVP